MLVANRPNVWYNMERGNDGAQACGQAKLLFDDLGVKCANPAGSQSLFRRRHHHLVNNDRRIDLARVHLVILAYPGALGLGAGDDDRWGAKDAAVTLKARAGEGGACKIVFARAHLNSRWVVVAGRRGNSTGFDYMCKHSIFNGTILVVAAGKTSARKIFKRHSNPFQKASA